jgi:hypothetical protein
MKYSWRIKHDPNHWSDNGKVCFAYLRQNGDLSE